VEVLEDGEHMVQSFNFFQSGDRGNVEFLEGEEHHGSGG
jgi:hypothetical protein